MVVSRYSAALNNLSKERLIPRISGRHSYTGGKGSFGFGSHVCRAGFLCETALGDFRVGDAIENGTRQSRAPLRAVAGTRAPAERPVSLDFAFCIVSRL